MIKYFRLLTFFSLISFSLYSFVLPENDWKKYELKGKVKTMSETIYYYGFDADKKEVKKIERFFNSSGYLEKEIYKKNDKINYILNYFYDKDGKLIESNDYTGTQYIHKYKIDKNKDLIETITEKNEPVLTVKINIYRNGKKIRSQSYYRIDVKSNRSIEMKGLGLFDLLSDYNYLYNKDGKIIEILDITSNIRIKHSYESLNNENYKEVVSQPGQAFITIFDKNYKEIEYAWITQPSSTMEPQYQLILLYDTKYDESGNLIENIANRVEWKDAKSNDYINKGIYEKKEIEYEYYN